MSHPGHQLVRCSECDRFLSQRYRFVNNKPVSVICDDCRRGFSDIERVSRAAEVAAASLIDLAKEIEKRFVKPGGEVEDASFDQ